MLWGTSIVSEYQFSYTPLISEAYRLTHFGPKWALRLAGAHLRAH